METNPKLSIITINLNNISGLRKTIESVLSQTFTDFEYIIIDGGSSDGGLEILKEFDKNITFWLSEPDAGIYCAMNKGILRSEGDYLLFLHSGDWLADDGVLSRIFSKSRSADILYGDMNFVTDGRFSLRKAADENQLTLSYFFNNSLCHPATFIARRLFNDNLYDESYKSAADKKFFTEKIIMSNCSIKRLNEVVSNFNTEGHSSRPENKILIKEENERILNQLMQPRMVKDLLLIKNNFVDFKALIKIKKYSLLYFFFKGLKKAATLFQTFIP